MSNIFSCFISASDWVDSIVNASLDWSIVPLVLIIFLAVRKQKPASVGFRRHHNLRACLIGTAVGILLTLLMCCILFFQGYHGAFGKLQKLKLTIITPLLYVVTIGLPEEIEFRAFLQSRICGIMKNRYAAVITVGLMFCGAHVFHDFLLTPAYLGIGKDWIVSELYSQAFLFGFHCLWLFLYKKNDNILAAAFGHGIYDYMILAVYS